MLARQEKPEEPYQEESAEQVEREGKRSDRREFVHHVLNTSLRSHFQVLFFVTALLAMLVTIGSGISASRGYTLVETQSEATRIEQENERLNVEIAKLKTRSASSQSRRASSACRSRRRRISRMKVNKMTRGCKDNEQLLLCLQDAWIRFRTRQKMSSSSVSGGEHLWIYARRIQCLVETLIGIFCLCKI